MKSLKIILLIAVCMIANIYVSIADTKQDIEKANKKGNVVFLVVTENGNSQNQAALILAKQAQKSYTNSSIVELDRGNVSNSSLIQKYRLAGAPVPLILVIGKNGIVSGGSAFQGLTVDGITSMIPTPKLESVHASISDGKPVILVFTKKSFKDTPETLKECNYALTLLKKDKINASLIEVDIDDARESKFLNQLRIDKSAKSPVVLVLNKDGQVSGTATTVPDAKKLASAITTKPKSGCGPGCGPAGCGK